MKKTSAETSKKATGLKRGRSKTPSSSSGPKTPKEQHKDTKESKELKVLKESKEPKVLKESKEQKEPKQSKGSKTVDEVSKTSRKRTDTPIKKRTPTPALSVERVREIQQITLKAKRNPSLTMALISRALKNDVRNKQYISNLNTCRNLLKEQKEMALVDADPVKVAKYEKKYADNLAKLDKIAKEGEETPGILKPEYEAFLKKIHPKKPVSGYMKFAQDVRHEIQGNNPSASFGEMGRLIGQAWKNLPEDKKSLYSKKKPQGKKQTKSEETESSCSSAESAISCGEEENNNASVIEDESMITST